MTVAEVPFDLVEVKLAPPHARPDTVARADADRAAVRVTLAGRDHRRAGRVRQDDAGCALGRSRPASVRVGRARRRGRRRPDAPALHRRRDPPRRTRAARGVRRVVGTGRIHVVEASPARRRRAGGARGSAGAGARRCARRRQSVVSGRPGGAGRLPPGGLADRDREPRGAGTSARPLAGARTGGRDRRG